MQIPEGAGETAMSRQSRTIRAALIGLSLAWGASDCLSVPAVAADGAVEITRRAESVSLANAHLRMDISVQGDRMRTIQLENRRAGQSLDLGGDDFQIHLADGRVVRSGDMELRDVIEEVATPAERRVTFQLQGGGLDVRCVNRLQADQWWATRWLEVRGAAGTLARISLADWQCGQASGPDGPGTAVATLGYPSGCGQVAYARDLFFAIAHPGAENFATRQGISCSIPAYQSLANDRDVTTQKLVVGAGEAGDAWRAFVRYIDATRPVPARMLFLVNDWYWKDKSKPLQAIEALVEMKRQSGLPVDTFTLDDGWDFDWDKTHKIWGRLNRERFPGGWDALQAAGRKADINISLWFGPIGGYSYRPKRIDFARQLGFEINGDKLCLCGPLYKQHVCDSFASWAARGMDYIKVDGFWPDCRQAEHGHPVGTGGAIAQMDALIDVFHSWRKARPGLLIGYTSGSHPSPFWLQHADYVWRGGRDDSHAGKGTPFDQHNTYLDSVLTAHRAGDLPMSAFVTFDIVQNRIRGGADEEYERGFWWLAGRTSLHHDWYVQASDLTLPQWRLLTRAANWARQHDKTFRFSRMFGGDPASGEVYGFSAFDGQRGTLALRNPSDGARTLKGTLAEWLRLPPHRRGTLQLRPVYGETATLAGPHQARDSLEIQLPALEIALFEVENE